MLTIKWLLIAGLILFLGIFLSLLIYLMIPPLADREAAGAEDFFQQFLASIISDSDFYKEHSTQSAIRQIQHHQDFFSGDYRDYRNICQIGRYKYYIIFSGRHEFSVNIEVSNNDFIVKDFSYGGIAKTQSPKPHMTENATEFFNKILLSINNETEFYKKYSTEQAIHEIQTYRSMITKNDILAYRQVEGAWEHFYFYVVFDEKHVFEVHIDFERGFLVKSFKYIGKNDGNWKIRGLENVSS